MNISFPAKSTMAIDIDARPVPETTTTPPITITSSAAGTAKETSRPIRATTSIKTDPPAIATTTLIQTARPAITESTPIQTDPQSIMPDIVTFYIELASDAVTLPTRAESVTSNSEDTKTESPYRVIAPDWDGVLAEVEVATAIPTDFADTEQDDDKKYQPATELTYATPDVALSQLVPQTLVPTAPDTTTKAITEAHIEESATFITKVEPEPLTNANEKQGEPEATKPTAANWWRWNTGMSRTITTPATKIGLFQ